jgi:hypothetical protein
MTAQSSGLLVNGVTQCSRHKDPLRVRRSGVRTSARQRIFILSIPFPADPGAPPVSSTVPTGDLPRRQSSRGVALTTHPHQGPSLRMSRTTDLLPIPFCASYGMSGGDLPLVSQPRTFSVFVIITLHIISAINTDFRVQTEISLNCS